MENLRIAFEPFIDDGVRRFIDDGINCYNINRARNPSCQPNIESRTSAKPCRHDG